ncbi:MAG: hypothetical protein CSA66_02150 [Proteobacteria bacterium]|nr:MAG: hypothetical protein CSA66_02150 [Pseudomonadota bacterium]
MNRHLTILIGALALLGGPDATAMTVDPAPLEVLWAEADAVVHGTVVATEAVAAPTSPRVHTQVTVVIWQVAKASRADAIGRTLSLTLPGGTLGRLRTVSPGVPRLTPGDELVLLLDRTPRGWLPIGYRLGALFVGDDGALRQAAPGGRPSPTPLLDAAWLSSALGVTR